MNMIGVSVDDNTRYQIRKIALNMTVSSHVAMMLMDCISVFPFIRLNVTVDSLNAISGLIM